MNAFVLPSTVAVLPASGCVVAGASGDVPPLLEPGPPGPSIVPGVQAASVTKARHHLIPHQACNSETDPNRTNTVAPIADRVHFQYAW